MIISSCTVYAAVVRVKQRQPGLHLPYHAPLSRTLPIRTVVTAVEPCRHQVTGQSSLGNATSMAPSNESVDMSTPNANFYVMRMLYAF